MNQLERSLKMARKWEVLVELVRVVAFMAFIFGFAYLLLKVLPMVF